MVWDQISHDSQRRVFAEPVQYGFKGVCVEPERERVEWTNSAAYLSVILSPVNLFQVRLHRLGF